MADVTFEVKLPPDLLRFGYDQARVQNSVKEWLVLSLFTDEAISSGKAAQLLGISRVEFLALLRKRGIAYIDYSPQELEDEFETVATMARDE
ncbi:MAG: UPF0175 family protein [Gammaproteobacteria bacterium]|nr:MAG: UPF0175 family protein [Gammaproteobacteria bacterium]